MLNPILFRARTQQSLTEATGDLVLRGFVGMTMALSHGLAKLPPAEGFVQAVGDLGFPAPAVFAWCATGAELLGGLFLALGLFTRPASAFVAFTMIVAAFGRHSADPFQKKELALVYLAIAVFYLLSGAGRFSLDAFLGRRSKR